MSLPNDVQSPDLELETIGFSPDQVTAYLQATFNQKRVEDVESYLQAHQLIQDLVRIPILLDALCFTWDDFKRKAVLQTMTAFYQAMEESLWKKDIVRLQKKKKDDELVTKDDIKSDNMAQMEKFVYSEVFLLEGLAFTGLLNNVINFELEHRRTIFEEFMLPDHDRLGDMDLRPLSFLRTLDPLSMDHNQAYHFLHLTFQEYFAARYFVRQWKAKQHLSCLQLSNRECNKIEPATLLKEHKYDPRYDIYWRFVAGLLGADREALGFFQAIRDGPRDLLGPTHQRLVMHCLSEVEQKRTAFTELRAKLKEELVKWLLLEYDLTEMCQLAREMECPEQVLVDALKQASKGAKRTLLIYLCRAVPPRVIDLVVPWLEDCSSEGLGRYILDLLRHQHKALRDTILQGITARLEDRDWFVQKRAIKVLQGRVDFIKEILQSIIV